MVLHSALSGLSKSILSFSTIRFIFHSVEQEIKPGLCLPYLALHTRLFSMYKQATLNLIHNAQLTHYSTYGLARRHHS